MPKPPFITRVQLRNFKSIARCDVEVGPLAILVGPNGSGKSNFLDALDLTVDALHVPMTHALSVRGGISEVLRRSGRRSTRFFEVTLDFNLLGEDASGQYSFAIERQRDGAFAVRREYCAIKRRSSSGGANHFEVQHGELVRTSAPNMPAPSSDRLFLVSASSFDDFRPVYDALTKMRLYKFDPEYIRRPQTPESTDSLHPPEGHNLAGVLWSLEQHYPSRFRRIQDYLKAVVPDVERIGRIPIRIVNRETIQFVQRADGTTTPRKFTAINMSDGTLRALAVLTALLQGGDSPPSLVGIEEPEIALHPAAAEVLWDAIREATESTQVFVTTHSSDLLDNPHIPIDAILSTDAGTGNTKIGSVDKHNMELLRRRLCTPGELLRQGMLLP